MTHFIDYRPAIPPESKFCSNAGHDAHHIVITKERRELSTVICYFALFPAITAAPLFRSFHKLQKAALLVNSGRVLPRGLRVAEIGQSFRIA